MRRSITFLLLLISASAAFAQAPYLVKDLPGAGEGTPQSSDPRFFRESGDKLFFVATNETDGLEPWVRDAGGVRLLRDINGGSGGSDPSFFMEVTPGVVLFTANDAVNGPQLWRSDGTEAGTTLVKSVNATTSFFAPSFSYGGKVFFTVDDGVHGREPWVSDGTADGTRLLVDTVPGSGSGVAATFFRFGNRTRFFAQGGIWSTDGTAAGTILDIPLAGYRAGVAVSAQAFYFFGYDSVHGLEPWKSDGTVSGTSMIKELRGGVTTYATSLAATPSGAVFFADDGSGSGGRLWRTDGTAANTVPLAALPASGTANYTSLLYQTSQGVFVLQGSNVWRTDGTEGGTYIATADASGSATSFFEAFSSIYFLSGYAGGRYLFRMDGSANGTAVSILPDLPVKNVTLTGGKLWMALTAAATGTELWVSHDGTASGTQMIANLAPDPGGRSSNPQNFKAAGPYLFFHPLLPRELWRSDGTSAGTSEITDIDNTLGTPAPFGFLTPFRGHIYYLRGHTGFHRVDAANGGATKIGDYNFDTLTADDNALYLASYGGAILASDGTAAGTVPLYDPNEPDHFKGYDFISILPYAGYSWIRCYHGLFRTGGTVATTRRIASMPDDRSYLYGGLAGAGGHLYSVMHSGAYGSELWRSDGTGAGSAMLVDANPGSESSNPSNFTAAGRLLFFTATTAAHGTELWRTDGSAAGTFMVKDIRPGITSSQLGALASVGEVVYFSANDGASGFELWKSDGTAAGTVVVRDLAPGSLSSRPAGLVAAAGRIWFSANDGLHGHELWSTDGTESGTVLAGDIIPGGSSSSPSQLTAAESTLFFTAATEVEGRELWAMPLTASYATVTGGRTAEGNSGTNALRFTIRRYGVSTAAASVAYAVLAGTATAGEDYTATAGTLQFASGETVKTVDVTILGDTVTEGNETVFLQLSSPWGMVLQQPIGTGVIDDEDSRADLAVELVQNADYDEASRLVKVTNHGPSNAVATELTFTESPYEFSIRAVDGVTCTATVPAQCTISFLQPGESRTLKILRHYVTGMVDPAWPAARTVTVQVSSSALDPNVSNNTASVLTTGNGKLVLPSYLAAGTSATATFDLGIDATSPTDVTLTSSAANVSISPATARIEAGQRTVAFTLTTTAGADKTLVTATIASVTQAALVARIVAGGQSATLDVAIVAEAKSTYGSGELFVIPVRVAARYPDGTRPAGIVTLYDESGNSLSQLTLDLEAAATFTQSDPQPGEHRYRVGYSGDDRFNPLIVPLPVITTKKAQPSLRIHAPGLTCSGDVEFRIVVGGSQGVPAPTGTVTLQTSDATFGPYTLVPTGVTGESGFTTTLTLAKGSRYVVATYNGDTRYVGATLRDDLTVGCSAMNFVATATSPTSVVFSWMPPSETTGTTSYEVYRGTSIEGPFQFVAKTSGLTASDNTAQSGRVYVYFVSAYNSGWTYYTSAPDVASTFRYTDQLLAAGTPIKSVHMSELRSMVAMLRNAAGQPLLAFSGSVTPRSVVWAAQLTELQDSVNASRARLGLAPIAWTQPGAANGMRIRAATLQELRGAAN